MRKLIVIGDDLYVRSFIQSGAFAQLDEETTYVASSRVTRLEELERLDGWRGTVDDPDERLWAYARIRAILMAAYRFRSRTLAIKTAQLPWRERLRVKFLALPGIRHRDIRRMFKQIGPHRGLQAVLSDVRPEIVIAPTAGTDTLVIDAVRCARDAGIPSLLLVNGWDNLSSKTTFSVLPDYLGVWGDQSVEHAVRIHGMPRERVFPIGVPTFQQHFDAQLETLERPYPFRYALFAGSALAFDELTALQALEESIQTNGPGDFKVVYRPHPWRQPRRRPDVFRAEEFRHVVLDPQVRDAYVASIGRTEPLGAADTLPSLDYYPSLLGGADFVICPLSTMTIEAAIMERPVLVLAYDDEVHSLPPSVVAEFDHFEGLDQIEGFFFARTLSELPTRFREMLALPPHPSLRKQIRPWLYFDDDSYALRLRRLLDGIGKKPSVASTFCSETCDDLSRVDQEIA